MDGTAKKMLARKTPSQRYPGKKVLFTAPPKSPTVADLYFGKMNAHPGTSSRNPDERPQRWFVVYHSPDLRQEAGGRTARNKSNQVLQRLTEHFQRRMAYRRSTKGAGKLRIGERNEIILSKRIQEVDKKGMQEGF
jgi:hypothetical protein